MTVSWRPGVPLDIARIKQAVLRWRGGMRYGGAVVTVVGVVEGIGRWEPGTGDRGPAATEPVSSRVRVPLLRATGTDQPFRLQARSPGPDPSTLRPGQPYRVTGPVIKSGEGKDNEIWLELERVEPVGSQK